MSSIYFLGIGGTAMASVAVALSHSGHAVSGSDTQLYPPMSNYLDTHNIRYFSGFSEENIQKASADLVVAGNAISRGNIELEYALNNRMELISMPDLVRRELIAQNTSLVVTGTHGKTTTTSLLAWLLQHGGLKPGFLVGEYLKTFRWHAGLQDGVKMVFLSLKETNMIRRFSTNGANFFFTGQTLLLSTILSLIMPIFSTLLTTSNEVSCFWSTSFPATGCCW